MNIKSLKDIKSLKPNGKKQTHSCGDNLFVTVRSAKDGGGKRFVGRMYHPITKKKVEKTIGNAETIKLSDAKRKWLFIKSEAKTKKCHPNKLNPSSNKTLNEVKDEYFSVLSTKIKPNTLREYKRQWERYILPNIEGDVPIKNYERRNEGRSIVECAFITIRGGEEGIKHELERKCRGLLKRTFEYANTKDWFGEGQNPVHTNRDALPTHTAQHHPRLDWDDVPSFLDKLETYQYQFAPQQVLCTKFILLTALRAGAAVQLKWSDINYEDKLITISGKTSGLKRVKGKNDSIPHLIPITKEIKQLIERAKKYKLSEEYVFAPITHSRYPHLDPSAPNAVFRGLGIKDSEGEMVVAHGWRGTFNTAGIDVIKGEDDVIKKQLGHLPKGKVNQAYNSSERLDERRKFLSKWGKELVRLGLRLM
mgnify:CR=1 FL=1